MAEGWGPGEVERRLLPVPGAPALWSSRYSPGSGLAPAEGGKAAGHPLEPCPCSFLPRPLHIAARNGLASVVQALLSRGATVLAVDEEGGWGLGSGTFFRR